MPLALLTSDLQLRVLLWPPSRDVFRASGACCGLRALLADERAAKVFWQRIAPLDGGTHSSQAVWLHTVAEAREVRGYVERAAVFDVFGRVRFWSQRQVEALLAELDQFPRRASCGAGRRRGKTLFVGQCRFSFDDVQELAHGGRCAPVRSSRVGLVWQDGAVRFDVFLEIAPEPEGGVSMDWQSSFTSNLLMETRDCIELDVSGSVVPMRQDGSVLPPVRAALGGALEPGSLQALLEAELVGVARVDFRFMGDAQTVHLAGDERKERAREMGDLSPAPSASLGGEEAAADRADSEHEGLCGEALDEEELDAILNGARIQSGGLPALPWLDRL